MQFLLSLFLLAVTPNLEQLMHSGLDALAAGNTHDAEASFLSASAIAPRNPEVWLALTQVYARENRTAKRDAAAARCVTLAHAAPDWERNASIRNYLGKVLLAQGAFPRAVAEYREAIRLNPYDEALRFDLARALLGHELFNDAVDALTDARAVFDKSPQIELALGTAYYGQRRFADAVTSFLRVIDLDPTIPQPYVFLGKMLDQAGDRLQDVQACFDRFAAANPNDYLPPLLRAKAMAQAGGDPAEILTLLRRSIVLNARNWESHYELGVSLDGAGDYAGAAAELERSVQLNARIAATHYRLARVYDRLHRPADAATQRALHQKLVGQGKGMEPAR